MQELLIHIRFLDRSQDTCKDLCQDDEGKGLIRALRIVVKGIGGIAFHRQAQPAGTPQLKDSSLLRMVHGSNTTPSLRRNRKQPQTSAVIENDPKLVQGEQLATEHEVSL